VNLPGSCVPSESTLCLGGARFEVTADWQVSPAFSGTGVATPLSLWSGTFWFFDHENLEILVKIVDGCDNPDYRNRWFYAAGLTDVGVTLRVRDTLTGELLTRSNPLGRRFESIRETGGFRSCP
jgi:hypothetical protein